MKQYEVAVVGGGASSIFFLNAYAKQRSGAQPVLWVRASDGVGVAYDTPHDSHILNVPAAKMGADPAEPLGFHAWLGEQNDGRTFDSNAFVPRKRYGEYLHSLAAKISLSPAVEVLRSEAIDCVEEVSGAAPLWRLTMSDGSVALASKVLIAVGTGVPMRSPDLPAEVVVDPWHWLLKEASKSGAIASLEEVTIIGSGLTAMDMVIALRERGYAGNIRVLSSSGRWSEHHERVEPLADDAKSALIEELIRRPSTRHYVSVIRRHVARYPWRAVLDAIRADTPRIWRKLSAQEQRRFVRHVFPLWNRHRHRAPRETWQQILADHKVSLTKCRVDLDGMTTVSRQQGKSLVLDCRGIGLGQEKMRPLWVQRLLDRGGLKESENRMGVAPSEPSRLEVIGALRFGFDFECTAVPELRSHANEIATRWAL